MTAKPRWLVVGVKYIASVSFGKDSLAMLLRLLEENKPLDVVIFYNTGMEFDAIYRLRDKMIPILASRGIEFVELQSPETFEFSMFDRKVKYRNKDGYHYGYGWCGGPARWGTRQKTSAIKKYKESLQDDVVDYVGIAADEVHRFQKEKSVGKILPLVEWGMTESDCLEYCYQRGWFWTEYTKLGEVELYSILKRVSCWCCANKNIFELRNIYLYLPEYWEKFRHLQSRIHRPIHGFYKGSPRGIFEYEERFKKEREISDGT